MDRTERRMKELLSGRRIKEETGCWLWKFSKTPKGYGKFNSNEFVHIVSFELFKGPRIPGLDVMHSCNTKHCFNPDHLSQGTRKKNIEDAGHDGLMNNRCTNKLTYKDAQSIRQRYKQGEKQKNLAIEYQVSRSYISLIVNNYKWKIRQESR